MAVFSHFEKYFRFISSKKSLLSLIIQLIKLKRWQKFNLISKIKLNSKDQEKFVVLKFQATDDSNSCEITSL